MIGGRREVVAQEKEWLEKGYLTLLRKLFPKGQTEGEFFRIGAEGDAGRRLAFNCDTGVFVDFADEDLRMHGICELMYYTEGWKGICRLANTFDLPFDWVVLNGVKPPSDEVYRFALKKDRTVAGQWAYTDFDGFYLGTRVRLEDSKGHKEFRLLAYRTRKVATINEKPVIFREGFRYDGSWSGIDPLYVTTTLIQNDKPILIAEGEKAADACREILGDTYECITWGSGSAGSPKKAFWDPIKGRSVVMWPDKDEPGRKAANKISAIIPSTKIVQVWDCEQLQEGDDLYDVKNDTDKSWIQLLLDTAVAGQAKVGAVVRDQFTYVTQTEKFYHIDTGLSYTPQSLKRAYMSSIDDLDTELLSDPGFKKVTHTTYFPGRPVFFDEQDLETGSITPRYNTWRDTGCESGNGEPSKFLEHIHGLIPDDVVREEILDYLAFCTQHQGTKTSFCPLITGEQGIGKSYLLQVMAAILGPSHVTEVTTENLSSNFNTWAEGSSMVFVEEIMALGKREITNRMKTYLTSPTLMIEGKGANVRKVPNRVNFMLFSNEQTPLILEKDDRRFLVYRSPMKSKDELYYDRLFASLEGGEMHDIRGYLERRNITEFIPNKRAIMTEAKQQIIASSESSALLALRLAVQSKRHPFTGDTVELLDVYEWASDNKLIRSYDKNPDRILQTAISSGHFVATSPEGVEMLVVRNHDKYRVVE